MNPSARALPAPSRPRRARVRSTGPAGRHVWWVGGFAGRRRSACAQRPHLQGRRGAEGGGSRWLARSRRRRSGQMPGSDRVSRAGPVARTAPKPPRPPRPERIRAGPTLGPGRRCRPTARNLKTLRTKFTYSLCEFSAWLCALHASFGSGRTWRCPSGRAHEGGAEAVHRRAVSRTGSPESDDSDTQPGKADFFVARARP